MLWGSVGNETTIQFKVLFCLVNKLQNIAPFTDIVNVSINLDALSICIMNNNLWSQDKFHISIDKINE